MQTFNVQEQFFNDKKAVMIRAFENEKKKEPYQRLGDQFSQIMHTSQFESEEFLKSLKEELTFKKFMDMKQKWL